MPLAFPSISHGEVVFGFFNIETDMLLLERYFFFASDFCRWISKIPEMFQLRQFTDKWRLFDIIDRSNIGDLMGAIHGYYFSGFIGEVYKVFPFPKRKEDFKQNPYGYLTQDKIIEIIKKFAVEREIVFSINREEQVISVGEYTFSFSEFQALIKYVWEGGYPKWNKGERPDYVIKLKNTILKNQIGPFMGLTFL